MESKYSILEAARAIGISKNTVKYRLRKLPPETISKDEAGRIWISADGLELLRKQAETAPDEQAGKSHQEPDERTTGFSAEPPRTGRRTSLNHLEPVKEPVYEPVSTSQRTTINHLEPVYEPPRTTDADQLDALRRQLDDLRADLSDAQQAAAVATAERDAERRRADDTAATVKELTAALQSEQQHAAELTALLQTANEQLTAALALNAGQIQLAMQQSEPAAVPTPADDQQTDTKPGYGSDDQSDTGSARTPDEHRDTAADQQQPGEDQSTGKRRGFFAWLFGKR